jgi:serine/threonine protein kinase
VHRDIKPQNVLISKAGEPLVTDFGLAKQLNELDGMTVSGQVVGTPSFMSPEQAQGRLSQVGPLSDVYSLGAVLYFVLTGRPPFHTASTVETLRQVVEQEPVSPRSLNPEVKRDLETICLKCLEKNPARRYASAQQLADDLGRFLSGDDILARPVGRLEKAGRWCRRHPSTAALIAVAALLLLVGVPLAASYQQPKRRGNWPPHRNTMPRSTKPARSSRAPSPAGHALPWPD